MREAREQEMTDHEARKDERCTVVERRLTNMADYSVQRAVMYSLTWSFHNDSVWMGRVARARGKKHDAGSGGGSGSWVDADADGGKATPAADAAEADPAVVDQAAADAKSNEAAVAEASELDGGAGEAGGITEDDLPNLISE